MKKLLGLLKIALFLIVEFPIRPRWAWYRARGFAYNYVFNSRHQARLGEYQDRMRPLHAGIAEALGCSEAEVAEAAGSELLKSMVVENNWVVSLPSLESPQGARSGGPIEKRYGPSPELMTATHVICSLVRPSMVVETGVARGFTSCAVLEALERNGHGRLFSVEMPSLHIGYASQVGELIPDHLRKRWTLEQGPSAVVLPRLFAREGGPQVYLYDSAASYDNQVTEFGLAAEHMPPGGILIADLLMTDAFAEIGERSDCRWLAVPQVKGYPIGLLVKNG